MQELATTQRGLVTLKSTFVSRHNYRTGPTFKLLHGNIGYADLDRLAIADVDTMFESLRNTRAIIFDMLGFPEFLAWSIAPRLTEKKDVTVALFKKPVVAGSDFKSNQHLWSRHFQEFAQTVDNSDKWKYKGKTVMLINEFEGSLTEHTGLFLEAVNNTVFIGSPTVGANGDVTRFEIPGGITLTLSGQSVRHADGRQLQRIGLQPHVPVTPTIKGIQSGKDEVLEKAIEWINENVK